MTPRLATCMLVALTLVPTGALGAAELAYRFLPGETFAFRSEGTSKKPTGGTAVSVLEHRFTVEAANPARLRDEISGTSTEFDVGSPTASFGLSPEGRVTGLSSSDLEHPIRGALVRNIPWLFPHLPSGNLQPGATWQSEGVIFSPKTSLVPDSATRVRVVDSCLYVGEELDAAGRLLHRIDFTTREKDGEAMKVRLAGSYRFDPERGRVVRAESDGKYIVKVGFITFTIPSTSKTRELDADL